uniref:Uncharacterized protein n=1 Tax=Arundo donax TaxID=35708 RepID=A0A0A8XSK2_ARUDO
MKHSKLESETCLLGKIFHPKSYYNSDSNVIQL